MVIGATPPSASRPDAEPIQDLDPNLVRLLQSNEQRHRGKARVLMSRLYRAVRRIGLLRGANDDRFGQVVKQDYVVGDGLSKARTWCDVTIPNSISITPDPPSRHGEASSKASIRSLGQILNRQDYLAALARFSAPDRAVLIRRAAKQFVDAYTQGSLKAKAPSLATKQYYTFYHVQVAVEFCQYQPENDFFPAPKAYNLQYGLQCLSKCLNLDRFLLYCDADRIEYECQTGVVKRSPGPESNQQSVRTESIDKTIKELESYRRQLNRNASLSIKSNKS